MQSAKRIIIQLLIISLCVCISSEYIRTTNCELHKFQCRNGECIINELLCDGTAHCKDASDETETECAKILCPVYAFRCNYGACINGDSVCNGIQDCVDNSDETQCMTTYNQTIQPTQTPHPIVRRNTRSCIAPLQPQNGYWKLHRSQCPNQQECDIPEGAEVELGSQVIYSCNAEYKIRGSKNVYCIRTGWSPIPECIKIRCTALSTASTEATCTYNSNSMSCDFPALPGTRAILRCRNRYQRESNTLLRNDEVTCNAYGQWDPEPIRCVLVCGTLPDAVISNDRREFPWYVHLYRRRSNIVLHHYCGASLIRENLLITTAHCVYDESKTGKQLIDAKQIYALTENAYKIHLSFDDPFYASKKNQVKNIYTTYEGNFVNDIAILELVESFTFSSKLVPVCIDFQTFNDQILLEADGKVSINVIPRNKRGAGNDGYVTVSTVRYIPFSQCIFENQTDQFIRDKFCTGYINESSICQHAKVLSQRGNGLVYKSNDIWYLRGVVSTISNEPLMLLPLSFCGNEWFPMYTRIASHTKWIEDVLTGLESNQSYTSDEDNSESLLLPTIIQPTVSPTQPASLSTSRRVTSSIGICRAPPQPQNGYWKLPRSRCSSEQDCDVPEGTELHIGSYLIYSCNAGYEMKGSTHVTCSFEEKWFNIPVCAEIRCKALSTVSTEARCTYDDKWVSCESPVLPRTRASLFCRNSYQHEPSLLARNQVRCKANGQWEPEPIRCVPVCGKLPADFTPLIINGVAPNITEFPWHASMYHDEPGESKKYFCGASVIQENLLITAAHCVYNEGTQQVTNKTIYIVTGNVFRDYDSPFHDLRLVRKNQVKNIYLMCDYIGLIGNYVSDIAILELVEPFVLSTWLVPVCIDTFSDVAVLEAGVFGKVAGFGRTAVGELSGVLQALTVPYIPYYQCRDASQNANVIEYSIVDKFCAGYSNGSSVCDGDSGSGLVFQTNSLWYLRGIVSVSLGTIQKGGTTRCDNKFYSLYTRVSNHIGWIQDVIARLKQNQTYSPCREKV